MMAQKRGETRALCLGVAMVVCAVIAYYILGTTVLPLYQKRCAPPSLQPLPEGLVCEEPLTSSCPSPGPPCQAGILFLRVEDSNAGEGGRKARLSPAGLEFQDLEVISTGGLSMGNIKGSEQMLP